MKQLFYRVQQEGNTKGLWYDRDGTFNNRIVDEYSFLRAHSLPMEFDSACSGGWLSAVARIEDLAVWFDNWEMQQLQASKIFIFAYTTEQIRWYEPYNHYLIHAETSLPVMKIEVS